MNRPQTPQGSESRQLSEADDLGGETNSNGFLPAWPPNWPEIRQSVDRAFERGDWGRYRGAAREELSRRLSELNQVTRCSLIPSGSLGVELALRFLGVGPGSSVVLCGYDYPGNFRAVELLGARPLLVDADASGFSLCPDSLSDEKLAEAEGSKAAPPVAAVIVSHLYGVPAQIHRIAQLCKRRGWKLVEDACQTPLMPIGGRLAGTWGDVGVLSFGGSKPLTAGTGGALLTSDERFASKLSQWQERPSDCSPLSELQAAALLPQLERLSECNRIRAETMSVLLDEVPWLNSAVETALPSDQATHYKLAFLRSDRAELLARLVELGIPAGEGYRSMHRSSDRRCGKLGDLERCQRFGEELCLIDHSALLAEGAARDELVKRLKLCG